MNDELNLGALPADTGQPAPDPHAELPQGQAPTADDFHEIKWNGRPTKVKYEDLINYAQQGYDYTRKMQSFSERERQYQGRLAQYEAVVGQINAFLEDQEKVKAYLAKKFTPQADPEDLVTAEHVNQRIAAERDRIAKEFQNRLATLENNLEIRQLEVKFSDQVNQIVGQVFETYPELKRIRNFERNLRDEVASHQPRSLEEARELFQTIAEQKAMDVRALIEEQKKAAVTGRNPLKVGIEPPNGGGGTPREGTDQQFRSVADPAFKSLIMQDIMNDLAAAQRSG